MKAVTLHQPWATLIALGHKHIETRSWTPPSSLIGETIAIHASSPRRWRNIAIGDEWIFGKPMLPEGTPWSLYRMKTSKLGDWRTCVEAHPLPEMAIVATATLAAVLPMVEVGADPPTDHLTIGVGKMHLWRYVGEPHGNRRRWSPWNPKGDGTPTDVEDQRPFGDYQPGRFAWMLEDVRPLELPVPAIGRQGIWDWRP